MMKSEKIAKNIISAKNGEFKIDSRTEEVCMVK